MREVDRGLVCVCLWWGIVVAFPLSFSRTQQYCFTHALHWRTLSLSQHLLCWVRTVCNNCIAVQPQWLMNNKIIIPIHAVIKWDWLYLPVCSHWAWSSIIIQSRGVRLCVYVWVRLCACFVCGGGGVGVKSHSGACEDKQSQREENDTNQLKHYCPLYSRLIRSSQGTRGFIDTSTQT